VLLAGTLLATACNEGVSVPSTTTEALESTTSVTLAPRLIPSELDLERLEPVIILIADGITFGTALPNDQRALETYVADPAVLDGAARVAYDSASATPLADVTALSIDPGAFHDQEVLDAFVLGVVEASGGSAVLEEIDGRPTLRTIATDGTNVRALGHENLLLIVQGVDDAAVLRVVRGVGAAIAAGQSGDGAQHTPIRALAAGELFIPVTTVGFAPYPEDEEVPDPPSLPGGFVGAEARLAIVAGERRGTVWVLETAATAFPSAEALEPAVAELVADGVRAEVSTVQVGRRVVHGADRASTVVRAFRHHNLVVVVQGREVDQVDAIVSAWSDAIGYS
jgi:hypothetical protein